jgi:hypothetical protein
MRLRLRLRWPRSLDFVLLDIFNAVR